MAEEGDLVEIDLTGNGLAGKGPYPVFKKGNLVAFADPTSGGTLSKLWDENKLHDWGYPAKLCNQFRWCLRNLGDVDEAEIPFFKVNFESVLFGQSSVELPVHDKEGKTRYYVVPHPKSGSLLKILDQNMNVVFERKGRGRITRAGLRTR